MVSCAKTTCSCRKSVDKKKVNGITFHRFPNDPVRRKKWIQFVNRGPWVPTTYSVLCSKHFSEICFDRSSRYYVRLKDDAVPSIDTTRERVQKISNPGTEVQISNMLLIPFNIYNKGNISLPSTSTRTVNTHRDSETIASFFQEEIITSREEELLTKLQNALRASRDRRKLFSARTNLFQRDKRIANMKSVLTQFRKKNYAQEEYSDVISKLTKIILHLLGSLLKPYHS